MYDVDAMIHLLVHPHYETNKPINELIQMQELLNSESYAKI